MEQGGYYSHPAFIRQRFGDVQKEIHSHPD
jgi:hypothetical protein